MPMQAPEFVLWEMAKTGSSFVRNVVTHEVGAAAILDRHAPAMQCPEELRGLLQVGTVREPLAWYRSLWLHLHADGHAASTKTAYMERIRSLAPATDFRSFLYGATHLPATWTGGYLIEELPVVPPRLSATGLWSWTVRYMHTDWAGAWIVDRLLPLEHIYEGVGALLQKNIRGYGPFNTANQLSIGTHVPPVVVDHTDVFDPEMRSWVKDADNELRDILYARVRAGSIQLR